MADGVLAGEAAKRLNTSKVTIRNLLKSGQLKGTKEPHGSTFYWVIDAASIAAFSARQGGKRGGKDDALSGQARADLTVRVERLEAELSALRPPAPDSITAERDNLRARVVDLQEALARAHAAAELQREADSQRAALTQHLLEALAISERVDELRRRAAAEFEEVLAATMRPGHPGEMA